MFVCVFDCMMCLESLDLEVKVFVHMNWAVYTSMMMFVWIFDCMMCLKSLDLKVKGCLYQMIRIIVYTSGIYWYDDICMNFWVYDMLGKLGFESLHSLVHGMFDFFHFLRLLFIWNDPNHSLSLYKRYNFWLYDMLGKLRFGSLHSLLHGMFDFFHLFGCCLCGLWIV